MTSEWLTAAEAAAYLKVSRRALLQWVREGSVRAYALHGQKRHVWRFLKEDLDASILVAASCSSSMISSSTSSAVRK